MKPRIRQLPLLAAAFAVSGCAAATDEPSEPTVQAQVSALSTTGYGAVAWEQLGNRSAVDQLAELKTQLPLLAGRDIALVLHWPSESLDLQERWEVVEEALRLGIRAYCIKPADFEHLKKLARMIRRRADGDNEDELEELPIARSRRRSTRR